MGKIIGTDEEQRGPSEKEVQELMEEFIWGKNLDEIGDIKRTESRIEKAERIIRGFEWRGGWKWKGKGNDGGSHSCPSCGGLQLEDGHEESCELADFLGRKHGEK